MMFHQLKKKDMTFSKIYYGTFKMLIVLNTHFGLASCDRMLQLQSNIYSSLALYNFQHAHFSTVKVHFECD